MEPAIGKPPIRRSHLAILCRFGLSLILLGIALTLMVHGWVQLSWWRTFRRCVSIAAALSLWLVIKRIEHRPIASYGFASWQRGQREILWGLWLGAGTLIALLTIGLLTGLCRFNVSDDAVRLWWTVVGFIPAALLITVLEELVFRGMLLQHLLPYSRVLGVVGNCALYAIVHLRTTTVDSSIGLELGGLLLLGIVLSLSYLKTGQLFCAVGLHASLAYGARVNKLLISFPDASLWWLTGTSRLVNGLIGWILLLFLGLIISRWPTRPSHSAR